MVQWIGDCKFITVNVCAMNLHWCVNVLGSIENIYILCISSNCVRKNAQCHIRKSNCLFAILMHIYAGGGGGDAKRMLETEIDR